jgi:hypothetical protein
MNSLDKILAALAIAGVGFFAGILVYIGYDSGLATAAWALITALAGILLGKKYEQRKYK